MRALTSGRYCCGDVVDRRISNFVSLNLRSAFNELVQGIQNFGITVPRVGVGVLLVIPEANCDSIHSARSKEGKFAFKAFLLSKGRNCFVLDLLGERD